MPHTQLQNVIATMIANGDSESCLPCNTRVDHVANRHLQNDKPTNTKAGICHPPNWMKANRNRRTIPTMLPITGTKLSRKLRMPHTQRQFSPVIHDQEGGYAGQDAGGDVVPK